MRWGKGALKLNIGIYVEEPICRICYIAEEDARHTIFEWKSLASWRNTINVDENPGYRINQNKFFKGPLDLTRMPGLPEP